MSLVSPAVRKATDTAVSRSRLPVLIAGAGIGGLACALSLARRGFAVHVHERRAVFEPEGAGIQIGPNGTRILRSLGLLERLDMLAGKPDAIHVRNGVSGATLARLPLGAWIAERHGAPYWVLHRQDLHGALLAAVRAEPSISLLMDSEIIGVTETNDGVSVETRAATAGQPTMGAGLIVADGLRSRLRDEVFDVPPLAFAGRSAARAVIDADYVPEPLRENAVGLWLAPRAHVVHYPVRGGRQTAVVFVRKDDTASDDWSTIVPQGWIDEVASALASEARQLLAVPKQWKKWALYTLKPPPFWHAGRIALLGDAAHPTLPFLAQGAVLALEDAAVIARLVANEDGDCRAAFSTYSLARCTRGRRVVAAAAQNGRAYHLDGIAARLRDATLATVPPGLFMRRYDWVYGWRPGD